MESLIFGLTVVIIMVITFLGIRRIFLKFERLEVGRINSICPYCMKLNKTFINTNYICKHCGINVIKKDVIKKIVFDFGYGYENISKEIKVLESLKLVQKGVNFSEIYIDISKNSGKVIKNLILDLINNPPKRSLKKVKLFVKGV
jgi:hypothetical protein